MRRTRIEHIIKNILFAGIVLLLFLPMIQDKKEIIDVHPLNGAITPIETPYFTMDSWLDGTYQIKQHVQEREENTQTGERNPFPSFDAQSRD